jgi:hypothetical protein
VPIQFRPYQIPIFQDNTTGVQILHWSRQIGKSYVLAAWSVDRLLSHPGRLVTGEDRSEAAKRIEELSGSTQEQLNAVALSSI